jgi:SAM-dependent methyltransferase
MIHCILCESDKTEHFFSDGGINYIICNKCRLIFVKPDHRLNPEEEKSRYDQHENNPEDEKYRNFLNHLLEPLEKRLHTGSFGLDFGSGPGPTLHIMFQEKGHQMNIYDPFYANNESVFEEQYDFITCTETAEHLFNPRIELDRLWSCLKPGGFLGLMTMLVPSLKEFPKWHYRRDDTHVIFFSDITLHWLATHWSASVDILNDRVAIFKKREIQ